MQITPSLGFKSVIANTGSKISRQYADTNTTKALKNMGIKEYEVVDSPINNTTYFIFGKTIDKIQKDYIVMPDKVICKAHKGHECRDREGVFTHLKSELQQNWTDGHAINLLNKHVTQINNVDAQ